MFNNCRNSILTFKGTSIISVMGLSTDKLETLFLNLEEAKNNENIPIFNFHLEQVALLAFCHFQQSLNHDSCG